MAYNPQNPYGHLINQQANMAEASDGAGSTPVVALVIFGAMLLLALGLCAVTYRQYVAPQASKVKKKRRGSSKYTSSQSSSWEGRRRSKKIDKQELQYYIQGYAYV